MVGDLGKTITDDQERFELFDLSRRKLLLTLITSFGAKGLHWVDVSRLTDKLLTLDGIKSAEEEKGCSYYFAQPTSLYIGSRNNLFTAVSHFTMWWCQKTLLRRKQNDGKAWKLKMRNKSSIGGWPAPRSSNLRPLEMRPFTNNGGWENLQ